jgi:dTDP-4-amino-4,6-dideoxygalactose transaminase
VLYFPGGLQASGRDNRRDIASEMEPITARGERHGLPLVEDTAQTPLANHRNQSLGTFGALGTHSSHEAGSVDPGEGGALLSDDPALAKRTTAIRKKGTNRSEFLDRRIDRNALPIWSAPPEVAPLQTCNRSHDFCGQVPRAK